MRLYSRKYPFAALAFVFLSLTSVAADANAQVKIDSPGRSSVVTGSSILVAGTLVERTRNVGVTVNGVSARLDLAHAGTKSDPFRWIAEVEAPAGQVKLKARVHLAEKSERNDGDDGVGASTVHVEFLPVARRVTLDASPSSGIVPLDVTFTVRTDPADEIVRFELDYEGNGTWDVVADTVPEEGLAFRYASAGIHRPVARVTMKDGTTATDSGIIDGQSFLTVNALLNDIWGAFGQSLGSKDVDSALLWLAGDTVREKYASRLTLIRPTLPQFAAGLRTIHPVSIGDDVAHSPGSRLRDEAAPTGSRPPGTNQDSWPGVRRRREPHRYVPG